MAVGWRWDLTVEIGVVWGYVQVEFDRAMDAGVDQLQVFHDLAVKVLAAGQWQCTWGVMDWSWLTMWSFGRCAASSRYLSKVAWTAAMALVRSASEEAMVLGTEGWREAEAKAILVLLLVLALFHRHHARGHDGGDGGGPREALPRLGGCSRPARVHARGRLWVGWKQGWLCSACAATVQRLGRHLTLRASGHSGSVSKRGASHSRQASGPAASGLVHRRRRQWLSTCFTTADRGRRVSGLSTRTRTNTGRWTSKGFSRRCTPSSPPPALLPMCMR